MPTTRSGFGRRRGDLGHGERGRVGREHGVGAADPVELREELLLRRELLDDRLDHEVAVREVGQLGRERESSDRLVARGLLELPLLDLAREEVADPVARLLGELHADLAADRVEAGFDAELRDPGAHRAEPDHADFPDLATAGDPTDGCRVTRRCTTEGAGPWLR